MEITILLYHRWHTSVNRERNILKISQSAKWQTREATASFPLFAVDGDVSLGTVHLAPEPLATRVKVMDWAGDLQNAAMWRLKGERIGALGVTLRDDGKAYWIIPVGTAIHLR